MKNSPFVLGPQSVRPLTDDRQHALQFVLIDIVSIIKFDDDYLSLIFSSTSNRTHLNIFYIYKVTF